MQTSLYKCFLTIICAAIQSVNSQGLIKAHPSIVNSTFQKELKHTVLEVCDVTKGTKAMTALLLWKVQQDPSCSRKLCSQQQDKYVF